MKHRLPSPRGTGDAMQRAVQEKEKLADELDRCKDQVKLVQVEKSLVEERLADLQGKMDAFQELGASLPSLGQEALIDRMQRDKNELETVNSKLLKELSQARAAELAAHRVQMPKLAEDLLKEKNLEIDQLKETIQSLSSRSKAGVEGTPFSWSSTVNTTAGSLEQLREAHGPAAVRLPDLSVITSKADGYFRSGKASAFSLQPVAESLDASHVLRVASKEIDSGQTDQQEITHSNFIAANELKEDFRNSISDDPDRGNDAVPLAGTNQRELFYEVVEKGDNFLDKTSTDREMSVPEMEVTTDTADANLSSLLEQKTAEIESLSCIVLEKEAEVFELQDKVQDADASITTLNNTVKKLSEELRRKTESCGTLQQAMDEKDLMATQLSDKIELYEDKINAYKVKVTELEGQLMANAEPNMVDQLKRLQEENADRIEGMENLNSIIKQKDMQLDVLNAEHRAEIAKLKVNEEASVMKQIELDQANKEGQELKNKLKVVEEDLEKINVEKLKLSTDLAKVTKEMSSIDTVVKEMTAQFKNEISSKEDDIDRLKIQLRQAFDEKKLAEANKHDVDIQLVEVQAKLKTIENRIDTDHPVRCPVNGGLPQDGEEDVEVGSLDDLTSLVQRELDISSELDQSLLNQLVSTNTTLTSRGEASEIQRLLKKVQDDGVRVLTLSERIFLSQHSKAVPNTGNKDLLKKFEQLQFDIEQERIVMEDLRSALDSEKRTCLEMMSKLTRERQLRTELEEQLAATKRQVVKERPSKGLCSLVDSDNEEFLNTIEEQRKQISCLEESLRQEKDNVVQLQHVLSVERRRGRQEETSQERRNEQDIEELRTELRAERSYREQLESRVGGSGKPGEVAKLIVSRLHGELDSERKKVRHLELELEKERQKYFDVFQEYKYQKAESVVGQNLDRISDMDNSWTRAWRSRELELERLVAELELRIDVAEKEEGRNKQQIENLQTELCQEREKNNSG